MQTRKINKHCTVTNANYDRVLTVVRRYMDESRVQGCTCEQCISAIVASALNSLPPHYSADREGEQEAGSPWVMVEVAVCEAMERVRAQPYHLSEPARSE